MQVEIKWGLGTAMTFPRTTIRLYHVVVDGKTRGSFTTEDYAIQWAREKYPQERHDKRHDGC